MMTHKLRGVLAFLQGSRLKGLAGICQAQTQLQPNGYLCSIPLWHKKRKRERWDEERGEMGDWEKEMGGPGTPQGRGGAIYTTL